MWLGAIVPFISTPFIYVNRLDQLTIPVFSARFESSQIIEKPGHCSYHDLHQSGNDRTEKGAEELTGAATVPKKEQLILRGTACLGTMLDKKQVSAELLSWGPGYPTS